MVIFMAVYGLVMGADEVEIGQDEADLYGLDFELFDGTLLSTSRPRRR